MPPRSIVGAIVLAWLATCSWLVIEHWLPWWKSNDQPPFVVEMADEVAPAYATWSIYRKEKKIGAGETRMTPRPDGMFELTSRLRDLELPAGITTAKLPLLLTTSTVNRDGELQKLEAKCTMLFNMFGNEIKMDAHIIGHVDGNQFLGECKVDSTYGHFTERLTPIHLTTKNAFSPLQPLQKYPSLRAGQSWVVSSVDPASEALAAAIRQVGNRMLADAFPNGKAPFKLPSMQAETPELRAEVQRDLETLTYKDKTYTCRLIVFKGESIKARTWVDIADGKVLRQEATGMGEVIVLQRE